MSMTLNINTDMGVQVKPEKSGGPTTKSNNAVELTVFV